MMVAEVTENKYAFKNNMKDPDGNPLPLGSVEVRIGSHQSNLGQIRNIFVRPAHWNFRVPLIGEQILIISAPANDWSTSGIKNVGYMYLTTLNSSDDLVWHQFSKVWRRKGLAPGGSSAERKSDKRENYTFPTPPKRTPNLQRYEGCDVYEGRFGATLRFGSTVKGGEMGIYAEKPTWDGSGNGDPIILMRVKKPTASNTNSQNSDQINNNKYEVEDLEKDEASLVLTTNQKLKKLKAGFDKNQDAKKLGQFDGKGQAVLSSHRVVINATKDMAFLIGKEKVIVTGKKVILQTEKHKVDLDELMDFLKKWLGEFSKLCQGTAFFSSPSGPTGPSNNVSQVMQLQTSDFNKFKQP